MASYWDRLLNQRVTRRRGITLAGGSAAAAAFLAACGGGGDDEGPDSAASRDTSGLVSDPEDTSKTAKKGGTLKIDGGEPLHFDGMAQGQGQLNVYNGFAYGSLVQNKVGYKEPSTFTEVVPDLAESWETSPDGLSVTFKLRQGVKWHNKAPVNGRLFDAEDVVKNWERYISLGSNNKAANAASVNPNAPIVSVTATDSKTVVYKLARPTSFFLQRLANMITGEAGSQYPKEAGNSFDPRKEQIGTGGFVLESFTPSVGLKYTRNPEYWNKTEPYVDRAEFFILPEYTARLAQFKTGALHYILVTPQDVLSVKRETPKLRMVQTLLAGNNPGPMVGFGWNNLPNGEKSPFLDVRVRRALSMALDREAFIDAFSNVSKFEAEGLPMDTYYYTAMGYLPNVTLDPRSKDFGPNAVYYTYNVEEAKKLIKAAYPNGMPEIESKYNTIAFFGADHKDQVQVMDQFARDVGFKVTTRGIDYNLEYLPKLVTSQGKHDGWVYRWGATSSQDPLDYYTWRWWSKSGPTSGSLGFGGTEGSKGDQSGDPAVDTIIEKAMAETDNRKRVTLIQDLQKHLAGMQYGVTRPGIANSFGLAWEAVGNFNVFQGDSRSGVAPLHQYTVWLNQEKAPFKST